MKGFKLITILVLLVFTVSVHADDWLVGVESNGDFTSLQAAIDSPLLESGDTIHVLPGIYEENIILPACRRVKIVSTDGAGSTIIMPEVYKKSNQKQKAVVLRGRSTFEGFTVMENPLNLSSSGDPGILDLFGTGNPWPVASTGIYATGPAEIKHNIVIGFRIGVCSSCPSGAMGNPAIVRFNECHSNDIGLSLCETTNVVRDNYLHDNYWLGVLVSHGACGELSNNLIVNNGNPERDASAGILCWQDYMRRPEFQMTPIISNNTIHGNRGPGILCRYVRGGLCTPVIHHCILTWNEGPGLQCESYFGDPDTVPYPIVHYCNFYQNIGGAHNEVARVIGCTYYNPMYEDGFYLNENSPCIDAGMLPGTWGTVLDIDDLDHKKVDLGYHHPPKSGQSDPHPLID